MTQSPDNSGEAPGNGQSSSGQPNGAQATPPPEAWHFPPPEPAQPPTVPAPPPGPSGTIPQYGTPPPYGASPAGGQPYGAGPGGGQPYGAGPAAGPSYGTQPQYGTSPPASPYAAPPPQYGVSQHYGMPQQPYPAYPGYGGAAQQPDPDLAEWWRRLLARLIDGIIVSLLTAPLWVVVAIRAFHRINRVVQRYPDLSTPAAQAALKQADGKLLGAAWVIVIASGLIWFLYDWLQHAKWGQTVGKRVLSIRVVSAYDRSPVTSGAAARRAAIFALMPMVPVVGTFFYLLNVLWQLWDRRRQCLHDKVANTIVVRAAAVQPAAQWPPPQQNPPW